jgi:uncharacterized protein (TIGR01777 family)
MRSLVTGATGFVGRALAASLENPRYLSRNPAKAPESLRGLEGHRWDPVSGPPDAGAFEGVETVYHLAGDPIADGRWTRAKKARMRDSRILGTRHLVQAMRELERRPKVMVCASAVGFYGDRGGEILDESSEPGKGFLPDLCREWEKEAAAATDAGIRTVMIRIGVVLGAGGGALAKMLLPFKMGVGGRLGRGAQWMSWIHLDDLVGLMRHAANEEGVSGPVNGVAPAPVNNAKFTRVLASTLRRPAIFPVPPFMLRLGLGELASVLLGSQRVLPRAAESAGYRFKHPSLQGALREILHR